MRFGALIVTYNRLEKLKHTLECYDKQTIPFDEVLVVNNASNDGTKEFLEEWKSQSSKYKRTVLHLNTNTGGSGGFSAGQTYYIKNDNVDWLWMSDDDAYPESQTVEKLESFLKDKDSKQISAVCGVVKENGNINYNHRRRLNYKCHFIDNCVNCSDNDYKAAFFDFDLFSYVASAVNMQILKTVGPCDPNFFIYYDDSEHSIRLRKYGRFICLSSLEIDHDCGFVLPNARKKEILSWRDYYDWRNCIVMYKRHHISTALYLSLFFILLSFGWFVKRQYTFECVKLRLISVKDAWLNRLGKHSIYKPGFSISRK